MIDGIEVIHTRGGCNSGSFVIDTLSIAYGGVPIGTVKRDSASQGVTDTLGYQNDDWGNGGTITGAMASDPSFGVMIRSTGTGICTFGQFDVRINLYYCGENLVSVQPSRPQHDLVLFPNPASDRVFLQTEQELGMVKVYSSMGQSLDLSIEEDHFDIGTLPRGTYFVVVALSDGQRITQKFIKQ